MLRAWITRLAEKLRRLTPLERALVVACVLGIAWMIVLSAQDCLEYNGVDLRPKVLGARAMFRGLNPYTYDWRPGMSEELLDPWRRHPGTTRAGYTPFLFFVYAPLAWLPFALQRKMWWCMEWGLLFVNLGLVARLAPSPRLRVPMVAVVVAFFVVSLGFRLHLERGQYYVIVVAMLLGGMRLALTGRRPWVSAALVGAAIALRPSFALLVVVLFLAGRRAIALRAGAAAVALCLAALAAIGVSGWKGYFEMLSCHADLPRCEETTMRNYGPSFPVPSVAEGLELRRMLEPVASRTTASIASFQYQLPPTTAAGKWLRETPVRQLEKTLGGAMALAGCAAALLAWRKRLSLRIAFALGVATSLAAEFFSVFERLPYTELLLVVPLAVLLPLALRHRPLAAWGGLVGLGLAAGTVHGDALGLPGQPWIVLVENLRFYTIVFGSLGALWILALRRRTMRRRT